MSIFAGVFPWEPAPAPVRRAKSLLRGLPLATPRMVTLLFFCHWNVNFSAISRVLVRLKSIKSHLWFCFAVGARSCLIPWFFYFELVMASVGIYFCLILCLSLSLFYCLQEYFSFKVNININCPNKCKLQFTPYLAAVLKKRLACEHVCVVLCMFVRYSSTAQLPTALILNL